MKEKAELGDAVGAYYFTQINKLGLYVSVPDSLCWAQNVTGLRSPR